MIISWRRFGHNIILEGSDTPGFEVGVLTSVGIRSCYAGINAYEGDHPLGHLDYGEDAGGTHDLAFPVESAAPLCGQRR